MKPSKTVINNHFGVKTMSRGDKPLHERLEEGEPIGNFFPTNNGSTPMDKAFRQSAVRKLIYFGNEPGRPAASAMGVPQSAPSPTLPPHVVTQTIEIEGLDGALYRWDYRTNRFSDGRLCLEPYLLRRVFSITNQVLALDISETLHWLSATEGSPRFESTLEQLGQEIEMDNNNNHVILQLMERNIQEGLPMLPRNARYGPIHY